MCLICHKQWQPIIVQKQICLLREFGYSMVELVNLFELNIRWLSFHYKQIRLDFSFASKLTLMPANYLSSLDDIKKTKQKCVSPLNIHYFDIAGTQAAAGVSLQIESDSVCQHCSYEPGGQMLVLYHYGGNGCNTNSHIFILMSATVLEIKLLCLLPEHNDITM